MITVWIDDFTPCIKDELTGELVNTEVLRLKRKSFLEKYNKNNGWYVNWATLLDSGNEIYALVIKGSVNIQGLIALAGSEDMQAVHIAWMVASPGNNPVFSENHSKRYSGVGGHLFAIAAQRSEEMGYEGAITGNASNIDLVKHYKEVFNSQHIGMLHPYQIFIDSPDTKIIREIYTYEWTNEEL